jgi:nucleoside-diphosphate-sugar epimerase
VADAKPVSTPDLVRALAAALGVAPRIVACPTPLLRAAMIVPGMGPRLSRLLDSLEVDATSFRTRFAWTPPLALEDGLAAAVRGTPPL